MVWPRDGVAVSPTDSPQIKPRIVTDGAGGAIVVWMDARLGLPLARAQRLDSGGSIAPGWPSAGLVLPARLSPQSNLAAIPDGMGGAFVASDDHGFTGFVMVHHLGHDGLPAAGWPSNMVTLKEAPYGQAGGTHGSFFPGLLADDSAGVYVVRTFRDRLHWSTAVTRLTSSGAFAPGWDSGKYAGAGVGDFQSVLSSNGQGGVFVALQSNPIPKRIFFTRLDKYGHRTLSFTSIAATAFDQLAPGIVSDGATGAIIVWEDRRNGLFSQIFAKHVLIDGSTAPGWPADGLAIASTPTAAGMPSDFDVPIRTPTDWPLTSIVSDGEGGAFLTWTDYRDSTGSGEGDIYAQHVLGDGVAPGWPVNGLAVCRGHGDQKLPTLVADHDGGVFVTWQDRRGHTGYDIYAQRVTRDGSVAPGWPHNGFALCKAAGDQTAPFAAPDGGDGVIVAWMDERDEVPQIYAARAISLGVGTTRSSLSEPVLALRALSPNPAVERLRVSFSLMTSDPATLELVDVTGRRLQSIHVGNLGRGAHDLEMVRGPALKPGLYVIRLTQGGSSARIKTVVAR